MAAGSDLQSGNAIVLSFCPAPPDSLAPGQAAHRRADAGERHLPPTPSALPLRGLVFVVGSLCR
jgi:hypothetical protein